MAVLRHLLFCLIPLLMVLCASVSAAALDGERPLLVGEVQRVLDDQIGLLRDPSGQLTVNEVAAPAMQPRFVSPRKGISLGFTRDIVWRRIPLRREAAAPSQWRLEASNAVIDDFRFYGPDGAGGQTLILRTGDRQAFAERPTRYRHPLFTVVLPDERQRVFYLRIAGTGAILLSLTLWQLDAFRLAAQPELIVIGLVFGMLVSTILMSVFCGVLIRDRRYLVFVAASLFFAETLATKLGLTSQLVFPRTPLIADALHSVNVCLLPSVVLLFMQQALRTKRYFPRMDVAVRWGVAGSALSTLSIPLDLFRVVGPFMELFLVLSITLFTWFSWQSYRAGRSGAGCFFAGALCLVLPTLWAVLSARGLIDGAAVIEASVVVAVLSFCLLVNVGLLLDFKSSHDDRLRAVAQSGHHQTMVVQEQRLREEQERLLAFVAHELRNTLGFMVYGLRNLRVGLADAGEEVQQRIVRLGKAARRMSELIDRSLRLQRLASNDFIPDLDGFSSGFPAIEACALVEESHPGCQVVCTLADDLPPEMVIDAELVTLALVNLLDNAIKYSPAGSPVTLTVGRDPARPGEVVYRVSDQGPGVPAADRLHLFSSFPRRASSRGTGFGIGLSLVANIVRHHGGRVEYLSAPDAGATFEIRLPVIPAPRGQTS